MEPFRDAFRKRESHAGKKTQPQETRERLRQEFRQKELSTQPASIANIPEPSGFDPTFGAVGNDR